MKKPAGWPRYMIVKPQKGGGTGYHWNPQKRDIDKGFTLGREALGPNYAQAVERAEVLNAHLDAWRQGREAKHHPEAQPGFGTMGWLFDQYRRSQPYRKKVGDRARPGYERAMRSIEDTPTKDGRTVAALPLSSISTLAVDKIYERLQQGPRKKTGRYTQANYAISIARRAWKVVHRRHPNVVPTFNPWIGVEREGKKSVKAAATRTEAYTLATSLKAIGEPHLGAAALICFEWHQRPEHVVEGGELKWADWRPPQQPKHVQVRHPKTGAMVWLPLEDDQGRLFPEIEAYLADLPRLGVPVVLTTGARGPARPSSMVYAQRLVREARKRAGLGAHVTLDACRNGGMTELGDSGVTEQGGMSLTGHSTPQAFRLYVKRTETQRMIAARQRRAWVDAKVEEKVEANETGSEVRIGRQTKSQNER
jgi:integrase